MSNSANRRVVVSGMDVVSPFGIGKKVFWDNLVQAKSAVKLINSFDTKGLQIKFASYLDLDDTEIDSYIENQKIIKTLSRAGRFLMVAADLAFQESGIELDSNDPYRLGTSIGAGGLGYWDFDGYELLNQIYLDSVDISQGIKTMNTEKLYLNINSGTHPLNTLKALPNIPTAHIAIKYQAKSNSATFSTACISSAQAIGEAYRSIKHNISDVVICGGSDSMINPNCIIMFNLLGVLSRNNDNYQTAARPFDKNRDGFMVGEASSVFILEDYEHCKKRNGNPLCEIVGYGNTTDAYRLTDPPPDSDGPIRAMNNALNDAGINCTNIDYINAHGTGTKLNDLLETQAIKKVFGDHADKVLISSTKSMIGHCVAAAGGIELANCILSLKAQTVTPTINLTNPDPDCDLNYCPNESRNAALNYVMSNSFGFGGQNACLIIKDI